MTNRLRYDPHVGNDDKSELPARPLIEKLEADPPQPQIVLPRAPDLLAQQGGEEESLDLRRRSSRDTDLRAEHHVEHLNIEGKRKRSILGTEDEEGPDPLTTAKLTRKVVEGKTMIAS